MDRYRLTLTIGPRRIMSGWWPDPDTAKRKLDRWINERGGVAATRITLTDEAEDGRVLRSWPDKAAR